MKKTILFLFGCLFTLNLYAQNDKKNLIEAHIAFGLGNYSNRYTPVIRIGMTGPSHMKYYGGIGVDYTRALLKQWDICTGFEYSYNHIVKHSSTEIHDLSLTTIPVQIKYRFKKFIYLKGGIFFNILERGGSEFITPSRTGISFGYGLGIGFEHILKNSGIMFSINPCIRWNGNRNIKIPETDWRMTYSLLQAGICLGVGYKF